MQMLSALLHIATDPWLQIAWGALLAAAVGVSPFGVLLVTRRMSLMGDALSHAILPGVAAGYFLAGFSLPALTLGGIVAGIAVVWAAGWASRNSNLFEEATLAGFQLSALAIGVLLLTARGNPIDVMHLLFGSILALNESAALLIILVSGIGLALLLLFRRAIAFEWFDPETFRRLDPAASAITHYGFFAFLVVLLVAILQALGVLLSLTLLTLPALTARLWSDRLPLLFLASAAIGALSSTLGLALSLTYDLPPGPTVAALLALLYLPSLLFAPYGLWRRRHPSRRHRIA